MSLRDRYRMLGDVNEYVNSWRETEGTDNKQDAHTRGPAHRSFGNSFQSKFLS